MTTNQVLLCECSSAEHQVLFTKLQDDEEVQISIHLTKKPFLQRLKYSLKYLFGYQCRYGAFEEVLTKKEKLQEIVDNLQ